MRILEEDLRSGVIRVLVEDQDDLWALFMLLKQGDIVYAKTTREVKAGEGGSSRRIPMTLGLQVEAVEFQEFTDRLRIRGIVVDGPEEYGVKGHYHTINVHPGDQVVLVREAWDEQSLSFLKDSVKKRRVLLVTVDYDEACVAVLTEQGVKYYDELRSNIPGKSYRVEYDELIKNYIESLESIVAGVLERENINAVIVAGPGDFKNRVAEAVKASRAGIPVYVDSTSTGGCHGVSELLRRDVARRIMGELSIVKARGILEEFKRLLISSPELVAYGLDDVYEAALYGAVSKAALTHELLREENEEKRERVYEALERIRKSRGEVVVVSSRSDVGAEIEGFGGIIALLRYRLFREHPPQEDVSPG